jgi:hypothetical protein
MFKVFILFAHLILKRLADIILYMYMYIIPDKFWKYATSSVFFTSTHGKQRDHQADLGVEGR